MHGDIRAKDVLQREGVISLTSFRSTSFITYDSIFYNDDRSDWPPRVHTGSIPDSQTCKDNVEVNFSCLSEPFAVPGHR